MSSQYIFTMYKLSRTHPPDKQVLKDISLSFLPGAKIGVLGLNGSGKSTLLRIMAGVDKDFRGEAVLAPGATVGLLMARLGERGRRVTSRIADVRAVRSVGNRTARGCGVERRHAVRGVRRCRGSDDGCPSPSRGTSRIADGADGLTPPPGSHR